MGRSAIAGTLVCERDAGDADDSRGQDQMTARFRAYLAAVIDHIREAGPWRVARRALVIWVIDSFALAVMGLALPGFYLGNLGAAVVAALVIGLLNALVRPTILAFAINLPLLLFGLVIFLFDALLLLLAGRWVPGLQVGSLWTALIASFGLSAITTGLTAVLHISDDDSFYRNVTSWLQRWSAPTGEPDRIGTVIIQIDGVAEPILRRALAEGRIPTLARWIGGPGHKSPAGGARGGGGEGETGGGASHRLAEWDCGVPSMTSSSEAGILWGNNANIPAFRWYDKEERRLLVSNRPADACLLDQRQATVGGLLRDGGAGINNIFTGGAACTVMTMATVVDDDGKLAVAPRDFGSFFVSPYNLTRLLLGVIGEIAREYWEAWQQRRRDEQPRMDRGGIFPLQRAGTNVLLEQLAVWLVVADIQSGRRVTYCDLLGYDEVAHHAGPASTDALRCLTGIDGQIRALEKAAQSAPRRHQFVVLSDHGQRWGATFRQRYGLTLEQLVQRLISAAHSVYQARQSGEGAG